MVVSRLPTDEKSMAYTIPNQTNPIVMMAAVEKAEIFIVSEVSRNWLKRRWRLMKNK